MYREREREKGAARHHWGAREGLRIVVVVELLNKII